MYHRTKINKGVRVSGSKNLKMQKPVSNLGGSQPEESDLGGRVLEEGGSRRPFASSSQFPSPSHVTRFVLVLRVSVCGFFLYQMYSNYTESLQCRHLLIK